MKFSYVNPATDDWKVISTEATDFDGRPPVTCLRVNWPYQAASPDRQAVAAALAFTYWGTGRLEFGSEISSLTAERIVDWYRCFHVWTSCQPIKSGALPIPRGTMTLSIIGSHRLTDVDTDFQLEFVESSVGTSIDQDRVRLASNSSFFVQPGAEFGPDFARLASLVLVANDLHLNAVYWSAAPPLSEHMKAGLVGLLECVSLGLVM